MAARTRYRQGLARYSPKRVAAARTRKRTEGPKQREERLRREAKAARGPRIRKPSTKPGERGWERFVPDTDETRWIRKASLEEFTASGGRSGEWLGELRSIGQKAWRAAYAEQSRRDRAGRASRSAFVKVKSYTRCKPGRQATCRVAGHRRRIGTRAV